MAAVWVFFAVAFGGVKAGLVALPFVVPLAVSDQVKPACSVVIGGLNSAIKVSSALAVG